MSAHPASQRRGWLNALVAQVADYVIEEVEETIEQPKELVAHPVVAVVAAAPRAGATTLARLLAAELAARGDGAAVVISSGRARRAAVPSRAAVRLATALSGAAQAQPAGRLCIVPAAASLPAAAAATPSACGSAAAASTQSESGSAVDGIARANAAVVSAARFLAPVVLDLPPDGTAAGVAAVADRAVVVSAASGEPALLDAVAGVIGGNPLKVVTRAAEPGKWAERVDVVLPESRIAARAAAIGTRAVGAMGAAVAQLTDALEVGP